MLQPRPRHDEAATDKTIYCDTCGASFVWTVNDQAFYQRVGYGSTPPRRCKACRDERQRTRDNWVQSAGAGDERQCKDCGETFIITPEEVAWFTHPSRQYDLPRRCAACRRQRRQDRNL